MADPHDKLFKAVFSEPANAIAHFRKFLAPGVVALLDVDKAALQNVSFIDEQLQSREADLLYEVPWTRDATEPERPPALLYLLFEHQSTVDPLMPRRLLTYMDRIWDRFVDDNPSTTRLPAILPLVLYHGAREWTAATRFGQLIDLPDAARHLIEPYLPMFEMILQDIPRMPDDQLTGTTFDAVARILLKHGRSERLTEVLLRLTEVLQVLATADLHRQSLAVEYVSVVNEHVRRPQLYSFVADHISKGAADMGLSLVQREREEGRAEGGRLMLLNQIALKFGTRDPRIEQRIMAASDAEVAGWGAGILTAPTLEALLGPDA
ncbi:MAG: Rpn family recombination-promoting nuclease/putative transposase [Myxococcota bacterium]